jgi:hypothetical protein
MLPESDRKDLAIRALARSATISDLSARHGVSRKFVYQQARKAGAALSRLTRGGLAASRTGHPSNRIRPSRTGGFRTPL